MYSELTVRLSDRSRVYSTFETNHPDREHRGFISGPTFVAVGERLVAAGTEGGGP